MLESGERQQVTSLPTERDISNTLEGVHEILDKGSPQEIRALLRDHMDPIDIDPDREARSRVNRAGFLSEGFRIQM